MGTGHDHARAASPSRPANRLAGEVSPYLLQHARNPVDWWPWGLDALAEAGRRQVPIFLSVGYSSCYWCHVMERESFEDEAVGRALSERFVCIKVDREERPDLDDIYMTAVQAMTGRGGWPMSVFLTPPGASGPGDPGLKPFWTGTYFPPTPRFGMPSFTQVIEGIDRAWREQREDVLRQADALADHLRDSIGRADARPVAIGAREVEAAVGGLLQSYDRVHGGFGPAPKFPQPSLLQFLMDAAAATDESTAAAVLAAVRHTLDRMAIGGMCDQVGGGFHRYSVDEKWLVPHFEKMLYDNALLLSVYARSYGERHDPFDAAVCRDVAAYVAREMTSAEGAFYSAQDAEVRGREGLNYLWTPEQVVAAIGEADARLAMRLFGMDGGPNFRDPHHPDEAPANVLFLPDRPDRLAARLGATPESLDAERARLRSELLRARAQRESPLLDDKTIAGWNGLMIAGLADAAAALSERPLRDAAARAAEWVWGAMRDADGVLLRTARGGVRKTPAFLEDYAFLARGMLALDAADRALGAPDPRWLDRAAVLVRQAQTLFGDPRTGALYDTRPGQTDVIVRARSARDGATPSGQSVMVHNFLDLAERTGDKDWTGAAAELLASMSADIADNPLGPIEATRGLLRLLRSDPARLAAASASTPAERAIEGAEQEEPVTPVLVLAEVERVAVPREGSATVRLRLEIAEGWHITAHDPFPAETAPDERVPGLVGLTVSLADGQAVRAAVAYPRGEPLRSAPGGLPPLLVHTGAVEFDVTLTRSAERWSGRPMLLLHYMPCTDNECLPPATVELDIAIDPA